MICKGVRRDGTPCGQTAKTGNKFCFWHLTGEQAKSKQDLARNLRLYTTKEMALVFQKEIRRFIRDKKYPESRLHELRRSFQTLAAFTGKKFKALDKEKKHLTLDERIKLADEKQNKERRLK